MHKRMSLLWIAAFIFVLACQKETSFDHDNIENPDLLSPIPDWNPEGLHRLCADLEVSIDQSGWRLDRKVIIQVCNVGNRRSYAPAFNFRIKFIGDTHPYIQHLESLAPGECQSYHIDLDNYDRDNFCGMEAYVTILPGYQHVDEYEMEDCNLANNRAIEILQICDEDYVPGQG